MAFGIVVGVVGPASAAPSLKVKPNTGLNDGQTVTLDVSGFSVTSSTLFGAVECTHGSIQLIDCDIADTLESTVQSTGTFTFSYNVVRHIVTPNSGPVDCALPRSCSIVVQPEDLSAAAAAPVEFTAPKADLRVLKVRLIHPVRPGEPVEVDATVVNGGRTPTTFDVVDIGSPGLLVVSATCAGAGRSAGPASCVYTPADAAVHQHVTTRFTLQFEAGASGLAQDRVCVHDENANNVDFHRRNNCAQVNIPIRGSS
jgi:hypothetical protein